MRQRPCSTDYVCSLVLGYLNASSIDHFTCHPVLPLQIHRVRDMWKTSGGKLLIETEYDEAFGTIFWELSLLSPIIEPVLIQDCGPIGEAAVNSSIYNDREYYIPDVCWRCQHHTYQKNAKKLLSDLSKHPQGHGFGCE